MLNYFVRDDYSITFFAFSEKEKQFFDATMHWIFTFPFKWDVFAKRIIHNPYLTFARDSTLLIRLGDFSLHDHEILFEIVKSFYRMGAITKMIYEKEVMILNFQTEKMVSFLVTPSHWMGYVYYTLLKEIYPKNIYPGGILHQAENSHIVDFCFQKNEKLYLFSSDTRVSKMSSILSQGVHLTEQPTRMMLKDNIHWYLMFSYEKENCITQFQQLMKRLTKEKIVELN